MFAVHLDDMISTALEHRMMMVAIEESLLEAESAPPPPPPRPVHPVRHAVTATEFAQEVECTVCLNRFRCGENAVKVKCGHLFHEECLGPWIEQHDTCPMCRGDIGD
jgi:E3 ubiquitin-protein ligase RNF115/126